jgi:hypothetical protein
MTSTTTTTLCECGQHDASTPFTNDGYVCRLLLARAMNSLKAGR